MTRDEWERVKDVVAGALSQPESGRRAYVAEQCGSDGAIRQQVESLLAAATAAAELYESGVLSVDGRTRRGPAKA